MMATNTNNHPIANEFNEAGVEIIPTDSEGSNDVDAAANSPNVDFNVVDVVPPAQAPAKSWPTKEVFIGAGALLCVVGGGSYLLAESHANASNKMMDFGSSQQQQMQQTAKKGRYNFELFAADGFCRDGQMKAYPHIEYDDVSSPEECGEKCSECPGKKQDGLKFRGFNYRPDDYCNCLVDQPGMGMVFDLDVCKGEGAASADASLEGSGEIEKAAVIKICKSGSCPECWKVSSPSSSKGRKSSKAPKSSKRPVRKLGQKNDSLLSNVERKTDSQIISE